MTLSSVGIVTDAGLDSDLVDRVSEETRHDDVRIVRGPASEVLAADPEAVVAIGESALLALVREGVSVPVLPVESGAGYGGVGETVALGAVENLLAEEFATESRAVLGVSVDGERVGRALADAMLVTSEPARISEYGVRSRGEQVAEFRADGVVVSTPTGSHGYGRSAGGPLVEPGSGVVSLVPVAPFAVNVDHWVLSADEPVELTVERDEGEVSLLLDDRAVRSIEPGIPVAVVADGELTLVHVGESPRFFER